MQDTIMHSEESLSLLLHIDGGPHTEYYLEGGNKSYYFGAITNQFSPNRNTSQRSTLLVKKRAALLLAALQRTLCTRRVGLCSSATHAPYYLQSTCNDKNHSLSNASDVFLWEMEALFAESELACNKSLTVSLLESLPVPKNESYTTEYCCANSTTAAMNETCTYGATKENGSYRYFPWPALDFSCENPLDGENTTSCANANETHSNGCNSPPGSGGDECTPQFAALVSFRCPMPVIIRDSSSSLSGFIVGSPAFEKALLEYSTSHQSANTSGGCVSENFDSTAEKNNDNSTNNTWCDADSPSKGWVFDEFWLTHFSKLLKKRFSREMDRLLDNLFNSTTHSNNNTNENQTIKTSDHPQGGFANNTYECGAGYSMTDSCVTASCTRNMRMKDVVSLAAADRFANIASFIYTAYLERRRLRPLGNDSSLRLTANSTSSIVEDEEGNYLFSPLFSPLLDPFFALMDAAIVPRETLLHKKQWEDSDSYNCSLSSSSNNTNNNSERPLSESFCGAKNGFSPDAFLLKSLLDGGTRMGDWVGAAEVRIGGDSADDDEMNNLFASYMKNIDLGNSFVTATSDKASSAPHGYDLALGWLIGVSVFSILAISGIMLARYFCGGSATEKVGQGIRVVEKVVVSDLFGLGKNETEGGDDEEGADGERLKRGAAADDNANEDDKRPKRPTQSGKKKIVGGAEIETVSATSSSVLSAVYTSLGISFSVVLFAVVLLFAANYSTAYVEEVSHFVLIAVYDSPQCGKSAYAPSPRELLYVPADGLCHRAAKIFTLPSLGAGDYLLRSSLSALLVNLNRTRTGHVEDNNNNEYTFNNSASRGEGAAVGDFSFYASLFGGQMGDGNLSHSSPLPLEVPSSSGLRGRRVAARRYRLAPSHSDNDANHSIISAWSVLHTTIGNGGPVVEYQVANVSQEEDQSQGFNFKDFYFFDESERSTLDSSSSSAQKSVGSRPYDSPSPSSGASSATTTTMYVRGTCGDRQQFAGRAWLSGGASSDECLGNVVEEHRATQANDDRVDGHGESNTVGRFFFSLFSSSSSSTTTSGKKKQTKTERSSCSSSRSLSSFIEVRCYTASEVAALAKYGLAMELVEQEIVRLSERSSSYASDGEDSMSVVNQATSSSPSTNTTTTTRGDGEQLEGSEVLTEPLPAHYRHDYSSDSYYYSAMNGDNSRNEVGKKEVFFVGDTRYFFDRPLIGNTTKEEVRARSFGSISDNYGGKEQQSASTKRCICGSAVCDGELPNGENHANDTASNVTMENMTVVTHACLCCSGSSSSNMSLGDYRAFSSNQAPLQVTERSTVPISYRFLAPPDSSLLLSSSHTKAPIAFVNTPFSSSTEAGGKKKKKINQWAVFEEPPLFITAEGSTIANRSLLYDGLISSSSRYYGMRGSAVDLGKVLQGTSLSKDGEQGASITLWTRLTPTSRGFLFAVADILETTSAQTRRQPPNATGVDSFFSWCGSNANETLDACGGGWYGNASNISDVRVTKDTAKYQVLAAPILDRVERSLGAKGQWDYFTDNYALYSGLHVDARSRTVRLVTARPLNRKRYYQDESAFKASLSVASVLEAFLSSSSGSGTEEDQADPRLDGVVEYAWSGEDVVGTLFDGRWHMLAIVFSRRGGVLGAQLFIDAASSHVESRWHVCLPEGAFSPIAERLPPITKPPPVSAHAYSNLMRYAASQDGRFSSTWAIAAWYFLGTNALRTTGIVRPLAGKGRSF